MKILYTTKTKDFPSGFAIRNPKYFVKPEQGVELINLDGDYPAIVEAYKKLNVAVEQKELKTDQAVDIIVEPDNMTVSELQDHLTELKIEFNPKAKKAELLALLKEE